MKIELTITKEFEVTLLNVDAGVRYWEDGTINGTEDEDGSNTPCKDGDRWKPQIELETGRITNWTEGVEAKIHYKICDDGTYSLIGIKGEEGMTIDGYVPDIMCPKGEGYGDYIKMDIDESGFIQNWDNDLSSFQPDED